jgi:hypothetical protein
VCGSNGADVSESVGTTQQRSAIQSRRLRGKLVAPVPRQCDLSSVRLPTPWLRTSSPSPRAPLDSVPSTFNRLSVEGASLCQSQISHKLLDNRYVSSGRVLDGTAFRIRRGATKPLDLADLYTRALNTQRPTVGSE